MKQIKRILSPYKRKLILAEKEWTYRITSKTIEICNPDRTKKYKFLYNGLIDDGSCGCGDYDNGWDCYHDNRPKYEPLGPARIKSIIEQKILKVS